MSSSPLFRTLLTAVSTLDHSKALDDLHWNDSIFSVPHSGATSPSHLEPGLPSFARDQHAKKPTCSGLCREEKQKGRLRLSQSIYAYCSLV